MGVDDQEYYVTQTPPPSPFPNYTRLPEQYQTINYATGAKNPVTLVISVVNVATGETHHRTTNTTRTGDNTHSQLTGPNQLHYLGRPLMFLATYLYTAII